MGPTPRADLQHDVTPAQWYVDGIDWRPDWRLVVGTFVPPAFEAYARILHPVHARSWVEVARTRGVSVGPDTVYHDVLGRQPAVSEEWPEEGNLVPAVMDPLLVHLGAATGTPDAVWFGLWDGLGNLQLPEGTPRFSIPSPALLPAPEPPPRGPGWAAFPGARVVGFRDYFLFHGPLGAANDFVRAAGWPAYERAQCPNVWWPEDRAWCVASEIDAVVTYVGGSRALIDALLADPAIECLPVEPDALCDPGVYPRPPAG